MKTSSSNKFPDLFFWRGAFVVRSGLYVVGEYRDASFLARVGMQLSLFCFLGYVHRLSPSFATSPGATTARIQWMFGGSGWEMVRWSDDEAYLAASFEMFGNHVSRVPWRGVFPMTRLRTFLIFKMYRWFYDIQHISYFLVGETIVHHV